MNKEISVGNDLGELPSLDKSSSSNSSGGLDKLMKSFNDNKLQIVAFLSFFLFIIFTMSLVLGSVDFTEAEKEKTYSGNKSLDKLYEEAGGNEALSNARMTSKIDLSTNDYSCSYFVEYEGNNKRNVYCTSCPEEDVTENDKFCRQFVYGDDGEFEYSLLDNEYVSQRRARKENEADIQFAAGDLPDCTRTLVDESKLGTSAERKGQICTLNTSGDTDSNLKTAECSADDIEIIRDLKYENKCDCSKFSNTDNDCNSNNDNHKCKISEDKESCQSATGEIDREGTNRWLIFKIGASIFLLLILSIIIKLLFKAKSVYKQLDFETGWFAFFQFVIFSYLIYRIYNYLKAWRNWAKQYENDDKIEANVDNGYKMKLYRHESYWLFLFAPFISLMIYAFAVFVIYLKNDGKNVLQKIVNNAIELVIVIIPTSIVAGSIIFIMTDGEDIEDDTDNEGTWPFNHLEKPVKE